jgi:hypothetical protein
MAKKPAATVKLEESKPDLPNPPAEEIFVQGVAACGKDAVALVHFKAKSVSDKPGAPKGAARPAVNVCSDHLIVIAGAEDFNMAERLVKKADLKVKGPKKALPLCNAPAA